MRIKARSDDASMLQMNDWLAELRDEDRAEPTQDDAAQSGTPVASAPNESAVHADTGTPAQVRTPAEVELPARAGTPAEAAVPARARPDAPARARPDAPARARPDAPARVRAGMPARVGTPVRVPARNGAPADASPAASASARAVIGDQIRMPIMWCEMGSCISWYTHLAALGEADTRARAIADGWRVDALGRLTCPECQQTDPRFWASCTVVPWDRYTAIARTTRITAVRSDGNRDWVPEISHDRGRRASGGPGRAASGPVAADSHLAASPVDSVWLRNYAAAKAM